MDLWLLQYFVPFFPMVPELWGGRTDRHVSFVAEHLINSYSALWQVVSFCVNHHCALIYGYRAVYL